MERFLKTRREFVTLAVKCLAGAAVLGSPFSFAALPKPKAILFDAFPIFDPRPVFALVEELFPGKGAELSNAWRTRQFEYTWLRNSMAAYKDFWQVTQDALVFAATSLKLDLTPEKRDRLMDSYLKLRAYPDAADSLKAMRAAGLRLAFLSNFTVKMLQAGISNSGLDGMFDHLLSTDAVRAFKPAPALTRWGSTLLNVSARKWSLPPLLDGMPWAQKSSAIGHSG
jgi:2-haloacid dehalogenase